MNNHLNTNNNTNKSRFVYNNVIGKKTHFYKHFGEHFNRLNKFQVDASDEFFDNENLYNISSNKQNEFKNINDFNDIRL